MTLQQQIKQTAQSWREEVARRRKVSAVDPVADALDYCAAEILELVSAAEKEGVTLTVAEYARRVRKDPATVRRWCRSGQVEAEQTVDGDYRIRLPGAA